MELNEETRRPMPSAAYRDRLSHHPLVPTFARYRRLSREIRRVSLTRALQYEILREFRLYGRVLDVGGGERAQYRPWLRCDSYESVNIDPSTEPTWVAEVGVQWPCPAGSFDSVISFNTLEHVFDARFVLLEIQRVLKDGGEALISTSFLFPMHGHPDDYFRPTPSWYREALGELGFSRLEVLPLVWGPFSTGQTCSSVPGPGKGLRRQIALLLDLLYGVRLRANRREGVLGRFATALLVRAVKQT